MATLRIKEVEERVPRLGSGGFIPSEHEVAQIAGDIIRLDGTRGPLADLHDATIAAQHPVRRRKRV